MLNGGLAGRQAGRYSLIAGLLAVALCGQVPSASLAATAAVALGAGAGYEARGTAELPNGESGTAELEVWGAEHCRLTVDLSRPGRERSFVAERDGKQTRVRTTGIAAGGPLSGLGQALAGGRACLLLPQGMDWGALVSGAANPVTASLDESTALPTTASWAPPVHLSRTASPPTPAAAVRYAEYESAGGISFPASVMLTLGGVNRLALRWTSFAPRAFAESDFALPLPPPHPRAAASGGAL